MYEKSRCVSSTFADVSLPKAFVVHKAEKTDVGVGDSGASSHMTNDATKVYDVRPPSPDKADITISDGTRRKAKQITLM